MYWVTPYFGQVYFGSWFSPFAESSWSFGSSYWIDGDTLRCLHQTVQSFKSIRRPAWPAVSKQQELESLYNVVEPGLLELFGELRTYLALPSTPSCPTERLRAAFVFIRTANSGRVIAARQMKNLRNTCRARRAPFGRLSMKSLHPLISDFFSLRNYFLIIYRAKEFSRGKRVSVSTKMSKFDAAYIIQRPLWRFRDNPLNALAAYYLAALPSDELSWQLVSRLVSTDVDKRSSLGERLCVRSVNPLSPFH